MLKGDLSTTPLAPLLLQLANEDSTGCLHILDANDDEALVFFKNGDVYAVNVPGRRPQLGAKLISSGALSPEALADALEAQRTELQGWRLGELLVHLGYVDQPVVEAFVKEQVNDALWDLLRWNDGRWKFRRNERAREDVAPPMSVAELLEAMRDRGGDWETISSVVHGPDAVPVLSSNDNASDETVLDSDAWSMLCKIDGQRTLAELARDGGYTVFEAGQVLVRLVQAGLVDLEETVSLDGSDPADDDLRSGASALLAALGGHVEAEGDEPEPELEPVDEAEDAIARLARLVGEVTSSIAEGGTGLEEPEPTPEVASETVFVPAARSALTPHSSLADPSVLQDLAPTSVHRESMSFADSIARVSAALSQVLGDEPAPVVVDSSPSPAAEVAAPAVVESPDDEYETIDRMRRIRAAAAAELAAAQSEANELRTDSKLRRIRSTFASFVGGGEPVRESEPVAESELLDEAEPEPLDEAELIDEAPDAEVVQLDERRQEAERLEAERVEAERLEQERLEAERLEAERLEAERLEAERLEAERVEAERLEQERLEAERIEAERIEAERLEAERLEAERIEAERLEAERLEAERLEAERIEAERLEAERIEAERAEAERLEQERLEAERLEAERLEAERVEAERLEQERLEAERLEAERIEAERLEAERAEAERLEAERLEQERLEAERIEAERLEAERLEQERLEAERLEAERIEAERIEAERLEAERLEQERIEAERVEAERLEAERLEQERLEAERIEAERLEAERFEAERLERKRVEQERLDQERFEAERLAAERLEAERQLAEREQAHAASMLLAELSQEPISEPEPTDPIAAEPEVYSAVPEPAPEPAIVGAPGLEMADTAALLRELSSLGGDEPPPPAAAPPRPRPAAKPTQPEKKKKRGLFGR